MAAMKAMKAMKAPKAMKTMKKAMKAMKKSKVGKGKMAKSLVFKGSREKTSGGLTKNTLVKNKSGKVVSKAASARGKKNFANSPLKRWMDAVTKARKELKIKGFCPVGGKTAAGKALYAKTKALLSK